MAFSPELLTPLDITEGYNDSVDDESSWTDYDVHLELKYYMTISFFTIYAIGFLVGMVGNILVIFAVVKSRRLHNVTCLFLANLAVADLLTVVFLIPVRIIVEFVGSWSLGDFGCRFASYLNIVSPVCSILTMMIISLERYYVVLYPLQAKSFVTMGRAKRVVAGLWLLSFTVSIPAIFSKKQFTHEYYDSRVYVCNNVWADNVEAKVYATYLFLLLFLIPLLVVSYAYMMLAWHLCSTRGRNIGSSNGSPFSSRGEGRYRVWYRNTSGWSDGSSFMRRAEIHRSNGVTLDEGATEADSLRSEHPRVEDINDSPAPRRHRNTGETDKIQRVVTMLAIVVALFIVSWGPLLTYTLVLKFIDKTRIPYTTSGILDLVFQFVAACNSCVNPIIYAFLSKNFRQSFKQVIRDCYHCGRERGDLLAHQPSYRWTRASRTSYSYAPPTSVLRTSPQRALSSKADV